MNTTLLWLTILGMGLITFSLRASLIMLLGRFELPPLLVRALRFVPAAVLSALVAPAILYKKGVFAPFDVRVLAGLLAAITAWRSKNILLTITIGMAAYWLLSWFNT